MSKRKDKEIRVTPHKMKERAQARLAELLLKYWKNNKHLSKVLKDAVTDSMIGNPVMIKAEWDEEKLEVRFRRVPNPESAT